MQQTGLNGAGSISTRNDSICKCSDLRGQRYVLSVSQIQFEIELREKECNYTTQSHFRTLVARTEML